MYGFWLGYLCILSCVLIFLIYTTLFIKKKVYKIIVSKEVKSLFAHVRRDIRVISH